MELETIATSRSVCTRGKLGWGEDGSTPESDDVFFFAFVDDSQLGLLRFSAYYRFCVHKFRRRRPCVHLFNPIVNVIGKKTSDLTFCGFFVRLVEKLHLISS